MSCKSISNLFDRGILRRWRYTYRFRGPSSHQRIHHLDSCQRWKRHGRGIYQRPRIINQIFSRQRVAENRSFDILSALVLSEPLTFPGTNGRKERILEREILTTITPQPLPKSMQPRKHPPLQPQIRHYSPPL